MFFPSFVIVAIVQSTNNKITIIAIAKNIWLIFFIFTRLTFPSTCRSSVQIIEDTSSGGRAIYEISNPHETFPVQFYAQRVLGSSTLSWAFLHTQLTHEASHNSYPHPRLAVASLSATLQLNLRVLITNYFRFSQIVVVWLAVVGGGGFHRNKMCWKLKLKRETRRRRNVKVFPSSVKSGNTCKIFQLVWEVPCAMMI